MTWQVLSYLISDSVYIDEGKCQSSMGALTPEKISAEDRTREVAI